MQSAIVTSNCIMYSSVGCSGSVTVDSAAVRASLNPMDSEPCHVISWHTLSRFIGREHLSRLFFPFMLHCRFSKSIIKYQLSNVKTPRSLIQYLNGVGAMPQGTDYLKVVLDGAHLLMWMASALSRQSAMAQQCETLKLS